MMRTIAVVVACALPAFATITSAQSSKTVCTKDYYGTVTCETRPTPRPVGSTWLAIANAAARGREEARQDDARTSELRVAAGRDSARTVLFVSRAVAVLTSARDSLGLIGREKGGSADAFWQEGSAALSLLGQADISASNTEMRDVLFPVVQKWAKKAYGFAARATAVTDSLAVQRRLTPAQKDHWIGELLNSGPIAILYASNLDASETEIRSAIIAAGK
jgi:hypothetical protein